MDAATLAQHLEAKRKGSEYLACCPAHEDTNPSFTFRDGDKGLVFKCHAGCSQEAVIDALKARGLWNGSTETRHAAPRKKRTADPPPPPVKEAETVVPPVVPIPDTAEGTFEAFANRAGNLVKAWPYHTAEGGLQFAVLRYNRYGGGKYFQPAYYGADGQWHNQQPFSSGRPLYRLPEILKSPGLPVLVVEGEKCSDTELPGFVLTTWSGGSDTVKATDWSPLDEREVIVWPDADTPGAKAATAIKCLLPNARVLEIPSDRPRGWDIADAAEEGEDLIAFISEHLPPADEGEVAAPEANVKDYGHAKTLSTFFLGRFRWAVHSKAWMRYDGRRWIPLPEERVQKLSADILRKEYGKQAARAKGKADVAELTRLMAEACTVSRVSGALEFLKGWPDIMTMAAEWDSNLWSLNVANGTVDLHTGELREHRAEDLLTKLAPVDFDPSAASEKWQAHLDLFLPDKDVQRQVRRDLGLALIGVTLEESLSIWHGGGGNGKTTTSRVLMGTLGDYATRAAPNLLIQSKYERHPTELADLASTRLVFSIEVDQGKKLAESLVKELTGGDTKKARRLYEDFFSFTQTFSIVLLVNHRPEIEGTDDGIWRRIRLIPWNETIAPERKRPQEDVLSELLNEGPAILAWLLAGLRDWQSDRQWMAEDVKIATAAYREDSDRIGPFLRMKCERSPRFEVPVSELHNCYATWCAEQEESPISKRDFEKIIREHGFSTKPRGKSNVVHWQGIRPTRRVEASPTSVKSPRESLPGKSTGNTTRQDSPSLETPPADFWETHDRDDPEHPLV